MPAGIDLRVRSLRPLLCAALCACALPARALDFKLLDGDLSGSLRTQISGGAMLRTEGQSARLIGKTNLPGQEQFCEDKVPAGAPPGTPAPGINCSNVAGNAAYLALPGYAGVNADNGDLNYKKGDLVSAAFKLAPRLQLNYGNWGVDVSGLFFYDLINSSFTEYHPNNLQDNNGFQPRNTQRAASAERDVGRSARLLDAYVSGTLPLPGDRELTVKAGEQVLSLGTSTTYVLNSLNTVNPPDINIRSLPGSDLRELFQREPLVVLASNLTEAFSAQAFYQYQWRKAPLPPIGSYFSTNDVLGDGNPYAVALFGKYREDPMNLVGKEARTQGNVYLLSSAGRTIYVDPERGPPEQGQWGASLSYLWQWLNNTTFSLTYLDLHSRFPNFNFIASDEGCTHQATNQVEAIADCQGFNGPAHLGKEPVPIDTIRIFLSYPEHVHALGASFSTNLGDVAWTGEVVFRPNQPLQIDSSDLGFAALNPVFPANNIDLVVQTIPARRTASPDYVETIYRHNPEIQPRQEIRGYERMQTVAYDMSLLFLKGASDNPFGADQMSNLIEFGAFQVLGMPGLDQLQFAAPGTQFHHSAGIDGTGTPTPQQNATGAGARLNPSYQAGGFASSFSYGYRLLNQLTYEDVLPKLKLQPQLAFFHDLSGRSPLPTGEFVSGRKQVVAGLSVGYGNSLTGSVRYSWSFGGGLTNLLSDRDNIQATLAYDF